MTDDLVVWLRAQLDEDERRVYIWDSDGRARVATMWVGPAPGYTTVASDHADGRWVADGRTVDDARHIAVLWDPARVLAEVEAKRRILALHGQSSASVCDLCSSDSHVVQMPCLTVRLLALPYADRPGYDERWRP